MAKPNVIQHVYLIFSFDPKSYHAGNWTNPAAEVAADPYRDAVHTLRGKKCNGPKGHAPSGTKTPCLSSTTIRHVHTLLKTAFDKAVDWRLIEESPVVCDAPKKNKTERRIWTPEMVRPALDDMEHSLLHLAVHLAFICSLRIGETVALTWEDVDFDQNLIRVRHTLQRVSREALDSVPADGLVQVFPPRVKKTNTVLVLKTPKTANSNRLCT